jgi:hypothetical protein
MSGLISKFAAFFLALIIYLHITLCSFFFEMGSLVGFEILELPRYFLQRARKLAQDPTLTS